MSDMRQDLRAENGRDQRHRTQHAPSGIRRLPGETHRASARPASILDNPDLAGNPVALAHARAIGRSGEPPASAGHPVGLALVFLVVIPTIVLLVSNPLGWFVLFMLCFGFAYLFGFGSIL